MRTECAELEPHLHDFVEGWLAESERARVEAHLRECPDCQRKVVGWVRISDALRDLPRLPAPRGRRIAVSLPPTLALREMAALWLVLCVPSAWLVSRWFAQGYLSQLGNYWPYSEFAVFSEQILNLALSLWKHLQGVLG